MLRSVARFAVARPTHGTRGSAGAAALSTAARPKVHIVEVGPRDGLQNEKTLVSAETKIELIARLAATGLGTVEATAFVSPKWVPQMGDAPTVLVGALARAPNVSLPVLTPNVQGLERAVAAGADEVAVFAAASESFSQRNINCSVAESLARFKPVCERARELRKRVRGYVSTVVACPYEGAVDPASVSRVARALLDMGCYQVSLGDTIGAGTPRDIDRLLARLDADGLPAAALALHCHDTYGTALANIYAGLARGIRTFDASVAGLGGCPYAPGATGNVATEDVVYMLDGCGFDTGVDLLALARVGQWISDEIGRPNASRAGRALLTRAARDASAAAKL